MPCDTTLAAMGQQCCSCPLRGQKATAGCRDVQTARQHIMFGQSHRPMFAKTLAGEDTFAPPFIV